MYMPKEKAQHENGGKEYENERQALPPARNHHPRGTGLQLAGHYYSGRSQNSFYGAVYEYTTGNHTCEGEIRLTAVSEERFADNGHAIAWAMAH